MKIHASNPMHRARYEVWVDGLNISNTIQEADDIAHEVWCVVRRPDGTPVRRPDGKVLLALVRGQVTIVSRINRPALVEAQ